MKGSGLHYAPTGGTGGLVADLQALVRKTIHSTAQFGAVALSCDQQQCMSHRKTSWKSNHSYDTPALKVGNWGLHQKGTLLPQHCHLQPALLLHGMFALHTLHQLAWSPSYRNTEDIPPSEMMRGHHFLCCQKFLGFPQAVATDSISAIIWAAVAFFPCQDCLQQGIHCGIGGKVHRFVLILRLI